MWYQCNDCITILILNMIRCIIVDDEIQARNVLRASLADVCPDVRIIAEASTVEDAVAYIDDYRPDVVLLDIELGDGSGFDVIERIKWKEFKVVFVTAYNQYAINAFRVNATDYLLKPVNILHLKDAIERVLKQPVEKQVGQIQQLLREMNNQLGRISFSTSDGYSVYDIKEIIRCESDNNYCRIFFVNGTSLYVSKTLKDIEEQLSNCGFERIHQSHLISIRHLKRYINKDGGYILMADGSQVPVSQRKRANIARLFDGYGL